MTTVDLKTRIAKIEKVMTDWPEWKRNVGSYQYHQNASMVKRDFCTVKRSSGKTK